MKKPAISILMVILLVSELACQKSIAIAKPTVVQSGPEPTQTATMAFATLSGQEDLVSLYKRVSPGVVAIQTLTDEGGGLGSGFVFDLDGNIITNYHVVENATQLEVDFPSGFKVSGEVKATDLDSDLAIIHVDAPATELHPLVLGDSDQVEVGQRVIAIGNPFGLNGTMTEGIISAKERALSSAHQTPAGDFYTAGDFIQTDAAINPGNSGGPLLNLAGEVIGVNRSIQTTDVNSAGEPLNSGIGFAVSVNIVRRVAPALIANGYYDYPYVGITSQNDMTLLEQQALNLPQTTGAYVVSVAAGGPADLAGIIGGSQPTSIQGLKSGGDLIIAVDHQPMLVFADMLSYLVTHKSPGDQVVLTLIRDHQEKEVTVTLGKRP
jgi:S1-C subfamily serine protease